jgi:hypothetical protein
MSLLVASYIKEIYMILDKGDIESEIYNNALNIKMTIKKLALSKNLSSFDLRVLDGVASGYSYSELSELLKVDRKRITTSFRKSCNKIAYLLGGDFTTDGFLEKHLSLRG